MNARKSIIKSSLNILDEEILSKTDVEKVIPPTNVRIIAAKIPNIEIYSLSIFFVLF